MAPGAHAGRVDARTVLLADDDEDFRVAIAEALDEEGYDVVAVPNGAAALAALEHAAKGRAPPPDLLLLDLLMPGMSGIEVLPGRASSGADYIAMRASWIGRGGYG